MPATYPECDVVRKALNISQVDLGNIPDWVKRILKQEYGIPMRGAAFQDYLNGLESLIGENAVDHWGTTTWNGIKGCFVTEPYGISTSKVLRLRELGRRLGFAVAYDSVSYHYPGSCDRVILFPITSRLDKESHPLAVVALLEAGGQLS